GECSALDVAKDDGAGLVMHDGGRETGCSRSSACRQLIEAHYLVNGDIVSDAHDEALAAIAHHEVLVGDAAGERLPGNAPRAAGKGRRPGDGILLGRHVD